MIDASWIQHGLGSRVMTTESAALQWSQSAPHVVGVIPFILMFYDLFTSCTMDDYLILYMYI